MKMNNITVNSKTIFLRCKNGVAYYALIVPYSKSLYSFPVPLDSMQEESFTAESHTIYFMEHIRNAIHDGTLLKEAA